MKINDVKIAVIGQGYVGLPLAIEFGKFFPTIGFDIEVNRVSDLSNGIDSTFEVTKSEIELSNYISFSCEVNDLRECNVYIVTVPTPIDQYNNPDLTPLKKASTMLGNIIRKGDIIIFESTVYPGVTEEECIPILEYESNLKFNQDFFAGYSPERINPSDKERKVSNILKITSGSTPEIADFIDELYCKIVLAGTYKASSIKVAEAAKVIENVQRDVNIALVNELSIIFNRIGLDTLEVLEAAGTKWNFLPFRPGLVGGHCIGVDPYYLTHKSKVSGYIPDMIITARRINDGMSSFVASQLVKQMMKKSIQVENSNVLILGFTFKENCPDLRNTKVIDIINELKEYNINVDVFDPWCAKELVMKEYSVLMLDELKVRFYDAIIIAVAHDLFKDMGEVNILNLGKKNNVIYDLKYVLPKEVVDVRL